MRLHARAVHVAFAIAASAIAASAIVSPAAAVPLSPAEITALCANAEDQAHCGRLIEARQMKAVERFVERNGDELRIQLASFGLTVFRDSINVTGAETYAVWDYYDDLETVVLFATEGERTQFWLVQRRGGGEFRIPSEPVLSPDHRRFVTADFCAAGCDNRIVVWTIARDGVRQELAWTPPAPWTDASAGWRSADTIKLEYSLAGEPGSRIAERRLSDPSWTKVPAK